MNLKRTSLILGSFFCIILTQAVAKEVYFGRSTLSLSLVSREPTIFRFPSQVKTISNQIGFKITPIDGESPDYRELKVTNDGSVKSAFVNFILDDGTLIRTKLTSYKRRIPERTDDIFTFVKRDAYEDKETKVVNVSKLDLLKSMIRGDKISGYKILRKDRWYRNIHPDLKIKLSKMYLGDKFNGYKFLIVNTSKTREYDIKLHEFSLGVGFEALLGQMDRKKLYPDGSKKNVSIVRIVSKSHSNFNQLSLPAPIGKEVVK